MEKNELTTEEWRDVPGYEGIYQVSNHGNVKRVKRSKGAVVNVVMKSAPNHYGYPRVSLCRDNSPKQHLVHRLVAAAFIGECQPGIEVNHIDGNKANARVENLEYVTSQGNSDHATQYGLMPHGTRRPLAKLDDEKVRKIRELREEGKLLRELAQMYGVSRRTIGDVIHGNLWQHVK